MTIEKQDIDEGKVGKFPDKAVSEGETETENVDVDADELGALDALQMGNCLHSKILLHQVTGILIREEGRLVPPFQAIRPQLGQKTIIARGQLSTSKIA